MGQNGHEFKEGYQKTFDGGVAIKMATRFRQGLLEELQSQMAEMPDLVELIARAIMDEPPLALKEGGMIRDGFDSALGRTAHRACAAARIGSPNCSRTKSRAPAFNRSRCDFNSVFGYYIEVTEIQPRQSAAAIHPQTDHCQWRALHHAGIEGDGRQDSRCRRAQRQAGVRTIPASARADSRTLPDIQKTAQALAQLDVLASFAETARLYNYCRPESWRRRRAVNSRWPASGAGTRLSRGAVRPE